jgi:electron transport complex protein RnfD
MNKNLLLTSSPHVHCGESIPIVMYNVIIALMPATLVGFYVFGFPAVRVVFLCCLFSVAVEYGWQKLLKQKITAFDGSAIVTGLLLGLNLPAASPWWVALIGSFVAIIIAKQVFGGLGHNPFNPALVARVFLLISFPVQMTKWMKPVFSGSFFSPDIVTEATPLGLVKEEVMLHGKIIHAKALSIFDLLIGNTGGCIGEVSAIALIAGGLYLIYRGYVRWQIPVFFIATVFIITGIVWVFNSNIYINPFYHIFSGGLMIGAFFMATDMVTSPITERGMIIFAIGCGLLTAVIRLWGGYPEGVSFAILLMNSVTPLIDKYVRPKKFGYNSSN